jgi:hypothetical protein
VKIWIYLLASALLLATGFGGGYQLRDWQATEAWAACAADIRFQTLEKCPTVIVTAFDAVKGDLAIKEIEYRDRAIPVIVQGSSDDRAAQTALLDRIAALSAVEKTNACAASPAFELRRRQLLDDLAAEGAGPSPGGADEAPR